MNKSLTFLSTQINYKIAPQLWSTTYEIKTIFPKLLLDAQQHCGGTNENEIDEYICYAILPYVNGKEVTPKLPVYNRLFQKKI